MSTTEEELEQVIKEATSALKALILEDLPGLERAYLNAGKGGLAIASKILIDSGSDPGSYKRGNRPGALR